MRTGPAGPSPRSRDPGGALAPGAAASGASWLRRPPACRGLASSGRAEHAGPWAGPRPGPFACALVVLLWLPSQPQRRPGTLSARARHAGGLAPVRSASLEPGQVARWIIGGRYAAAAFPEAVDSRYPVLIGVRGDSDRRRPCHQGHDRRRPCSRAERALSLPAGVRRPRARGRRHRRRGRGRASASPSGRT